MTALEKLTAVMREWNLDFTSWPDHVEPETIHACLRQRVRGETFADGDDHCFGEGPDLESAIVDLLGKVGAL